MLLTIARTPARTLARTLARAALVALIAGQSLAPASADTLRIDVAELGRALEAADGEPDALRRLVLERLQARFDEAGLAFEDDALLWRDTLLDERIESGCNRTDVRRLDTELRARGDTALSLTLVSLHEPIRVALALRADLAASGRARQRLGVDLFGRCRGLARDSFSFEADGPVSLDLSLTLTLEPSYEAASGAIALRPRLLVDGALAEPDIRVDVDDSLLEGPIERLLERRIRDAFGPERVRRELDALQSRAEAALGELLDEEGVVRVLLPDPDDAQIRALAQRLSPDARFPLPIAYLERHAVELLAALILGDEARVSEILGDAAVCEASTALQVALAHRPLHAIGSEGCRPVPFEADEPLYADAACQRPLDTVPTDALAFCETVLDETRLGNAAADVDTLDRWTLSPGTRLDVLALPLADSLQPFTTRVRWKTVETAQGTCELEMRVHVPHPDSGETRRPLIAFHGGSWQRRSTGFLGIESMATQFVDAGFVVFAPFHRLIGTEEGGAACNDATLAAVLEDADDALDWVLANGAGYGASGAPVLFGQSSGGHLAASLALSRPAEIERAALFYAPLDFGDFVAGVREGDYANEVGQRTLERVIGRPLEEIGEGDPLIAANSFPERVSRALADPSAPAPPPLFLLHGEADTLLPARQSVRMCDALGGRLSGSGGSGDTGVDGPPVSDPSGEAAVSDGTDALRRVIDCDAAGSELHLIAEGEHTLDLCIADGLCLAGSDASAVRVADSVARMLDWAAGGDTTARAATADASSAVGGACGPLAVLLLLWRRRGGA